ncbi:MAG: gluconate 2-dehydrogenase subunit 3 family protein [Myxococcota bacterium]|nr:gluconate 2-dehydrogenase subunit 3 family protein [Myxococcota bacterium]
MSSDTPRSAGLSPEQERALACLLDEIIPPSRDGRFPGAGEIGLAHTIEEAFGRIPGFDAVISDGLAALDELARSRGAEGFAALQGETRTEVLKAYDEREPGFVPGLVFQTYTAYYLEPRVVEALGLEARPPHPKGYEMEPNDLSLLDPVRARSGPARRA